MSEVGKISFLSKLLKFAYLALINYGFKNRLNYSSVEIRNRFIYIYFFFYTKCVYYIILYGFRYTRKRLTDTNPDDEELAKLRPALEDAKRFKDYLEKENQRLWTKLNETQYDSIDEEEAETVE